MAEATAPGMVRVLTEAALPACALAGVLVLIFAVTITNISVEQKQKRALVAEDEGGSARGGSPSPTGSERVLNVDIEIWRSGADPDPTPQHELAEASSSQQPAASCHEEELAGQHTEAGATRAHTPAALARGAWDTEIRSLDDSHASSLASFHRPTGSRTPRESDSRDLEIGIPSALAVWA